MCANLHRHTGLPVVSDDRAETTQRVPDQSLACSKKAHTRGRRPSRRRVLEGRTIAWGEPCSSRSTELTTEATKDGLLRFEVKAFLERDERKRESLHGRSGLLTSTQSVPCNHWGRTQKNTSHASFTIGYSILMFLAALIDRPISRLSHWAALGHRSNQMRPRKIYSSHRESYAASMMITRAELIKLAEGFRLNVQLPGQRSTDVGINRLCGEPPSPVCLARPLNEFRRSGQRRGLDVRLHLFYEPQTHAEAIARVRLNLR